MNLLTEVLGYLAIVAGFYAVTKKDMGSFRFWHLVSSLFYIVYGFLLQSSPLVIAGVIFCIIHLYHLRKLKTNQKNKTQIS